MRIKVTRIEIWEVESEDRVEPRIDIHDLHDSIQDDILNSQEVEAQTDDARFTYVPKETVELRVEEAK